MATAAPKRVTVAEFLEWDGGTGTRYGLVRGEIIAMAPPAERSGMTVGNLARSSVASEIPMRHAPGPVRPCVASTIC